MPGPRAPVIVPPMPRSEPGVAPRWTAQPGVADRRIAGVVLLDGVPIAGARVTLGAQYLAMAGLAGEESRTTDATGRFDFERHPAQTYLLTAMHTSAAEVRYVVDTRVPTIPTDGLELRMERCSTVIYGHIYDAEGGAIAGARLRPVTQWMLGQGATTDARGAYELCVSGFVQMRISADGYGAILASDIYQEGRHRRDFALYPAGVLSGRVVRADTGDPVAHALVYARAPTAMGGQQAAASSITRSSDDGSFELTDLGSGQYSVAASMGPWRSTTWTDVSVLSEEHARVDVVVEGTATVSGMAVHGDNPLSGVELRLRRTAPKFWSRTAMTQSDGSFVVTGVPTGEVRFDLGELAVEEPATLQIDQPEHDGIIVRVAPHASISGVVLRDGAPVPAAHVRLHSAGSASASSLWEMMLPSTHSGPDGAFLLRPVKPGSYRVQAVSDELEAFSPDVHVTVREASPVDGVALELSLAATIEGRVVDRRGDPVVHTRVYAYLDGGDDVGLATTDANGRFRIGMLSGGGDYVLEVWPPWGGAPLAHARGSDHRVSLAHGSSHARGVRVVVDFERLSITGRVIAPPDTPLAGVDVVLTGPPHLGEDGKAAISLDRMAKEYTVVSRSDGRFAFHDLAAGSYSLTAIAGRGAKTVTRGVEAGASDVTLTIESVGTIHGTLAGFDAVPDVRVASERETLWLSDRAAVVRRDEFVVHGLPPGTYVVVAETPNARAQRSVVVRAGETSSVDLAARDSGAVEGRAYDAENGEAAAGLRCWASPADASLPGLSFSPHADSATTEDDGGFRLPNVPAGQSEIICMGDEPIRLGSVTSDVAAGSVTAVVVPVVRIQTNAPGDIGLEVAPDTRPPRVTKIAPGSPADAAGLQPGDRIMRISGVPTANLGSAGMMALLRQRPPGTSIDLVIQREGKEQSATVVVPSR